MLKRNAGLLVVMIAIAAVASAGKLTPSAQIGHGTAPSPHAVLYSQVANPSGGGAAAQDFESSYDAYDCYTGDDFVVTDAAGWTVQQIHVPGSYSVAGPAAGIQYQFLTNAGGFPGTAVCSGTATVASDLAGDITATLPTVCNLTPAGTYWLSVAARMDFAAAGQWYVSTEAVTTGNIARWLNPGDGFGNGCTAWTSCAISVINAAYLDMSFEILGQVTPVELQSFTIK
jgi:hypothetical protein